VRLPSRPVSRFWCTLSWCDRLPDRQHLGLRLRCVVNKDPRVITVRRSTVVRVGIAVLALAALGLAFAVGLTVASTSSPSTTSTTSSTAKGATTTTGGVSTTTSAGTTSTLAALVAVLPCGPGSTPHVRPTRLVVGCADQKATVTDIVWNSWDPATGGQGTGTLHEGLASAPAIVVVFRDVAGIFQDVSITPSQNLSATTTTAVGTRPRTTSTSGGVPPVAATQPGSGWGGD
jgi:hypothetical protein